MYIFFLLLLSFLSVVIYIPMEVWEKMNGSSFYAYHSEFYLVQGNTHTDFWRSHAAAGPWNWKTDEGFLLINRGVTSLHNRECKSSGVVLRLTVPY